MTKIYRRHIAKTITWRITGTLDTILLSWLISGSPLIGLKIGVAEVITKMILYYFHENVWFNVDIKESQKRHLLKTITWRVVGTIETIALSWVISGDIPTGLKIGAAEVITKMILYYFHERIWYKTDYGIEKRRHLKKNIVEHKYRIGVNQRRKLNSHNSFLVFFTGLSGSGKSTVADALEEKLFKKNIRTYLLDGDNVRRGVNRNLGFSPEDRSENNRRIGEISKLFIDAGLVVLAAFVAPYKKDRVFIKETVRKENFVEVFVNTSLAECEKRDIKGLYRKARKGEITDMTGISAPYEKPENPDVEITEWNSIEESVEEIYRVIKNKLEL